jgi:hypothetical protein
MKKNTNFLNTLAMSRMIRGSIKMVLDLAWSLLRTLLISLMEILHSQVCIMKEVILPLISDYQM